MARNYKYPNLKAEMARLRESQEDLSKLLNICQMSVSNKLRGETDWTIGEIEILCDHYKKDYYELFKKD